MNNGFDDLGKLIRLSKHFKKKAEGPATTRPIPELLDELRHQPQTDKEQKYIKTIIKELLGRIKAYENGTLKEDVDEATIDEARKLLGLTALAYLRHNSKTLSRISSLNKVLKLASRFAHLAQPLQGQELLVYAKSMGQESIEAPEDWSALDLQAVGMSVYSAEQLHFPAVARGYYSRNQISDWMGWVMHEVKNKMENLFYNVRLDGNKYSVWVTGITNLDDIMIKIQADFNSASKFNKFNANITFDFRIEPVKTGSAYQENIVLAPPPKGAVSKDDKEINMSIKDVSDMLMNKISSGLQSYRDSIREE